MPLLTPKIVLQALKDRAPNLLAKMTDNGTLDAFVQERIDLANETLDYAIDEIHRRTPQSLKMSNPMEWVGRINAQNEEARREAIEQALEFEEIDEDPPA